jgi:pimeloyl-ACP methyl ester carboxylesterase
MGLTSGLFLAVVVGAVVVVPIATVLLWSRLRGPRPVRNAQRLGLIALCQGTAVLLAALLINNNFGLYTSWSDLLGDDGGLGNIQAGAPVAAAAVGPKAASADRPLPNFKLFHLDGRGSDEYITTITGPTSHVTGQVLVWVPPQYGQKEYAHTAFPVIQLFSGNPGSAGSWFHGLNGPAILLQQIQHRASRPFILVSAAINVDPPHNPDCSNIPHGPQVATWLTQDVHDLVLTSFRTESARTGWGLMGFSEGGLCASKLALQYPQEFSAAVSMSGDDHPDGDLLKPGTLAYEQNSPLWLLQHKPAPRVALLLTGTLQDGSTAAEAEAMGRAAKAPTVVEKLIAARGGHNVGVWKAVEPAAFAWLSEHLDAGQSPPQNSSQLAAPTFVGAQG